MPSAKLQEMINAVLSHSGDGTNESLIIPSHLTQMKTFGIRQGVELYPEFDDQLRTRLEFIKKLWKSNKLDIYLDRLWDILICRGSLLLYLRPTDSPGNYRIQHYYGGPGQDRQYKCYYDALGNLEEVVIVYPYEVRSLLDLPGTKRWVKLQINKDFIYQSEHEIRPDFTPASNAVGVVVLQNSLGFIPCIDVLNYPLEDGRGVDDFSALDKQICRHDDMSKAVADNMEFFGNPMLITTRTSQEVLEANPSSSGLRVFRPSLSSFGTFIGGDNPATRVDDPRMRAAMGGLKVKKIIGGVEADERFGFIHPDPVSSDHRNYLTEYRETLRTALGGVDELGFAAGATAFEIKSLYGRAAATAMKKCRALYTHGLCELFEMAIFAEEELFRSHLAFLIKKPVEQINDQLIADLFQKQQIPPQTMGLMPLGDRQVRWRWTGPVFEDSPKDILDRSIVGRNLQEMGVKTSEILRFIYPDRTDREINNLTAGGFAYRYLTNISGAIQQFLGLWGQLLQMPDPQTGGSLGQRLDLVPLIEQALQSLANELIRNNEYGTADPGDDFGKSASFAPASVSAGGTLSGATPNAPTSSAADAGVPASQLSPGGVSTASGGIYVPGIGSVAPIFSDYGYAVPATVPGSDRTISGAISSGLAPGAANSISGGPGSGNVTPERFAALPKPGSTVNVSWNQSGYPTSVGLPNGINPGSRYLSSGLSADGPANGPANDGTSGTRRLRRRRS